jgi:hypothetical protein
MARLLLVLSGPKTASLEPGGRKLCEHEPGAMAGPARMVADGMAHFSVMSIAFKVQDFARAGTGQGSSDQPSLNQGFPDNNLRFKIIYRQAAHGYLRRIIGTIGGYY